MVEQIPAPIPSVLQHQSLASPAIPEPTTTSADFSLRFAPSPFQAQGEISPGKNALLPCTTAGFTPPRFDHKSFAVSCPLALLSSAFYPILVHRLAAYAPRFLPTLGRPHAVALHFVSCDQLTAGLAPAGVRPCWADKKKTHRRGADGSSYLRREIAGEVSLPPKNSISERAEQLGHDSE